MELIKTEYKGVFEMNQAEKLEISIIGHSGSTYVEPFYFLISDLLALKVDLNHIGLSVNLNGAPTLTINTHYYEECVVAESVGGWNQYPVFEGSRLDCMHYMDGNIALGYGSDNTAIHLASEWEVDYL